MMKTILSLFFTFCAFNTQAQNVRDTIKVQKDLGRIYIYEGKKLKPKQMLAIMKPNPAAYNEMKRAKTNYDVGSVFGFAGGFLVGWSIGSLISTGEVDWRVAGAGAGLIGVSIPFSIGQAKHTKKAVRLFNDGTKSPTTSIHFRINCNVSNVGIVANF
jgi:hypothetical protein